MPKLLCFKGTYWLRILSSWLLILSGDYLLTLCVWRFFFSWFCLKWGFTYQILSWKFFLLFVRGLFSLVDSWYCHENVPVNWNPFLELMLTNCSPPSSPHDFTKNNTWKFNGFFRKLKIFAVWLFCSLSSHHLCSFILLASSSFSSIKNIKDRSVLGFRIES